MFGQMPALEAITIKPSLGCPDLEVLRHSESLRVKIVGPTDKPPLVDLRPLQGLPIRELFPESVELVENYMETLQTLKELRVLRLPNVDKAAASVVAHE